MGLQRDRFTVYVHDADQHLHEHVAVITHQDMLRGEKALTDTPGASDAQHLALVTAWCWASLMRQSDYAGAWQQFRDMDCQGVEKMDPVDVDPTPLAMTDTSP